MKRVEIKLENGHLNFAAQLSFTRETTLRFALSFFFFYFLVGGFASLFSRIYISFHLVYFLIFLSFPSILINSNIFMRFLIFYAKYFQIDKHFAQMRQILWSKYFLWVTMIHIFYYKFLCWITCIDRNLFYRFYTFTWES